MSTFIAIEYIGEVSRAIARRTITTQLIARSLAYSQIQKPIHLSEAIYN